MQVYLDNAATTCLDDRVLKKMLPYFNISYGNPSSIHSLGQEAYLSLERERENVAKILGGDKEGIIFSASASEANNLIISGVAMRNRTETRNRIIISAIEHPSVLEAAKRLEREGFKLDLLPVDKNGIVNPKSLEEKIGDDVVLVSVMMVNNEIGSIQKTKQLAKIAHQHGSYFHADAVQAVPYLNIDIKKMGLDCLSLSAHKFYGPKGVGLAYIDPEIKIRPLVVGGGQEKNIRSGTYNLAGIVGLSEALSLAYQERDKYLKKITDLRDYFLKKLKKEIPEAHLNTSISTRVPANLNILFRNIEGEAILIDLSEKGILVSTGSACSASDLRSSYVLKAIGLSDHYLNSNIRFSLGRYNTKAEIDYTIKSLKKTVARLREFSPIK